MNNTTKKTDTISRKLLRRLRKLRPSSAQSSDGVNASAADPSIYEAIGSPIENPYEAIGSPIENPYEEIGRSQQPSELQPDSSSQSSAGVNPSAAGFAIYETIVSVTSSGAGPIYGTIPPELPPRNGLPPSGRVGIPSDYNHTYENIRSSQQPSELQSKNGSSKSSAGVNASTADHTYENIPLPLGNASAAGPTYENTRSSQQLSELPSSGGVNASAANHTYENIPLPLGNASATSSAGVNAFVANPTYEKFENTRFSQQPPYDVPKKPPVNVGAGNGIDDASHSEDRVPNQIGEVTVQPSEGLGRG